MRLPCMIVAQTVVFYMIQAEVIERKKKALEMHSMMRMLIFQTT